MFISIGWSWKSEKILSTSASFAGSETYFCVPTSTLTSASAALGWRLTQSCEATQTVRLLDTWTSSPWFAAKPLTVPVWTTLVSCCSSAR